MAALRLHSPGLHKRTRPLPQLETHHLPDDADGAEGDGSGAPDGPDGPGAMLRSAWKWLTAGWFLLMRQPIFMPAAALAILYMTVLSLGMLMTAFLYSQGLTELEIGIFRCGGPRKRPSFPPRLPACSHAAGPFFLSGW